MSTAPFTITTDTSDGPETTPAEVRTWARLITVHGEAQGFHLYLEEASWSDGPTRREAYPPVSGTIVFCMDMQSKAAHPAHGTGSPGDGEITGTFTTAQFMAMVDGLVALRQRAIDEGIIPISAVTQQMITGRTE